MVSSFSVPTIPPLGVHEVANVHCVRRRGCCSSRGRRNSIRQVAKGSHAPLRSIQAAQKVKQRAYELGFEEVGITDVTPPPHRNELENWMSAGMAGTMTYMHRQLSKRREPAQIVPGATRVVVVTYNYFGADPAKPKRRGRVAKYARGRDYHLALAEPLRQLAEFICSLGGPDTLAKYYVDAGPVPERELAQRAGIGWIGKNTMLIHPRRGSFFFIGSVFTDLNLDVDPPFQADRCGTCTKCLEACPTSAFPEERVLDSRRCISYLTIELRGDIAEEYASAMSDMVFGCDICQDVCPWNEKFTAPAVEDLLRMRDDLAYIDLEELEQMSPEQFDERYGQTPMERPGFDGMRRNAKIALLNSGED